MSASRGALCTKPPDKKNCRRTSPFSPSRSSAHKIETALQFHKKSGRAPNFLSPEREKTSERELSDVRVRPEPNTLVGKAKAFRQNKKIPFQKERGFLHISELALRNCAYRACASAGTTIYTSVCVDLVLAVALSDSANRALARARAAHNAAATDNICHWYCTSKCILQIYCTTCSEKSNKNRWLVFGNFYHGA